MSVVDRVAMVVDIGFQFVVPDIKMDVSRFIIWLVVHYPFCDDHVICINHLQLNRSGACNDLDLSTNF